ncbi:small conductance mechanosensitive channel [Dysgonomonas alginatilytica]|uniref:Small conductance mechanosensitive channel n=1 Tax=Dysgonomonas alginatilytica TaxID=1605892 RepID=A0A2V3PNL5_9BACT|nr:mechanosensitive ion channel family protein [Dysgonomonas alginatilytica]PXV62692.1 small conductance mechanosensitive channel [Dysgonomonas alginatilytica]
MLGFILLQNIKEISPSALEPLLQGLIDRLIGLGEKLIVAAIVYFIGSWLISWLLKLVKKILSRKLIDGAVQTFINSLVNTILRVVLIVAIIGILGIPTTSLAAIIAAGGLAIGMAMKDNLSNFAGGIMILLNKPFKLRDRILVQGMDGVVMEIGILYTILLTADGRTIYIPNGPLSTGSITNYSTQENRRVDIVLNINYGNNADELKAALTEVVNRNEKVLQAPTPFVGITNINNGNFDIVIRAWVLNEDYGGVSVDLNEAIYNTLSQKGVFAASSLSVRMVN